MKIKLQHTGECCDCGWEGEWTEGGISDIEVEVPDAVVKDWRETIAHLDELETYFDERVKPQIEAEEARRWELRKPQDGQRVDFATRKWSSELLAQCLRDTWFIKWP